MPYCMNCGTKLPEGAKFCMECGTPLGGVAPEAARPAPQPQGGAGPEKRRRVFYNQTNDGMALLDDKLYCVSDSEHLYQVDLGEPGNVKTTVLDYSSSHMAYWQGSLYFLSGDDLVRRGIARQSRNVVVSLSDPRSARAREILAGHFSWCLNDTFTIQNCTYYILGAEFQVDSSGLERLNGTYLMGYDLRYDNWIIRKLPDLRTLPMPEGYKKPGMDGRRWDYGVPLQYIFVGGNLLASDRNTGLCACYPIEDPEHARLLPNGSCHIQGRFSASYNRSLFVKLKDDCVVTGGEDGIMLVSLKQGRAKCINDKLHGNGFWYRVPPAELVVGSNRLNMGTGALSRTPFSLCVKDFLITEDHYYALSHAVTSSSCNTLYRLPLDFLDTVKSQEELERFAVAEIY